MDAFDKLAWSKYLAAPTGPGPNRRAGSRVEIGSIGILKFGRAGRSRATNMAKRQRCPDKGHGDYRWIDCQHTRAEATGEGGGTRIREQFPPKSGEETHDEEFALLRMENLRMQIRFEYKLMRQRESRESTTGDAPTPSRRYGLQQHLRSAPYQDRLRLVLVCPHPNLTIRYVVPSPERSE